MRPSSLLALLSNFIVMASVVLSQTNDPQDSILDLLTKGSSVRGFAVNNGMPTATPAAVPRYSFNILLAAIMRFPELEQLLLSSHCGLTLFAPTDQALFNLRTSHMPYSKHLFASNTTLLHFLKYHILNNTFTPFIGNNSRTFQHTLSKERLRIDVHNGKVTAGSGSGTPALIVETIIVFNGVVNVIDNYPLVPPKPFGTALKWKGLTAASNNAALVNNLVLTLNMIKNATFFVPSNSAFKTFPTMFPNLNLTASLGIISSLLDLHLVRPALFESSLTRKIQSQSIATGLRGNNLTIAYNGTKVSVAGEGNTFVPIIVESDILLTGGSVMHVVDIIPLMSAQAFAAAVAINTTVLPSF